MRAAETPQTAETPAGGVSAWAQRALAHAHRITNAAPGRGSATRAEAQAADYVQAQLESLGIGAVERQPFEGLKSIWFFLALVFGLALMGHLAYWLLSPGLGSWIAWLVSAALFGYACWLMWRKFTYQSYPHGESLPRGASQNLLASLPPSGAETRQVVLVGHLDSHRAVIWFAADVLVTIYALVSPLLVYGLLAAPLFYLAGMISGLAVFGWLGAALALLHFLGWFTGVTADLGPFSPGANDNAAAVGSLLAVAERLHQQPLQNTRVWLAFTGCEETGCEGMRQLLDKYADTWREALFIDLELVGIGERLAYLQSEGVVRKRRIDAQTEQLVQQAAGAMGIQALNGAGVGVFTETGAVWERGLRGVTLLCLRKDSQLLPEWHRLSDTAERLEPAALEQTHQLVWALLAKLDSE